MSEFSDISDHSTNLASLFSARDSMYEEIRQMFHMEWTEQPTGDWIKPTMSPSSFNAVMGALRLMTSTEPQLNANKGASKDKLEKAARAIWDGSGRVSLRAAHYDMIFSGLLFGEIAASVSRTSDLVEHAKATGREDSIARAKYIAGETPYLMNTYNPATCYPDRDHLGLRGMLRKTKTTWGAVVDDWGNMALEMSATKSRLDPVELWDWYDYARRVVWVPGVGDEALFNDKHDLAFMPIVHGITEGTMLFTQPEQQRFPLLYGVWKSGMWKRENLSLTTMFSLIFALASNPLLVHETNDEDPLIIDRTLPGGLVRVKPGDKLTQLAEKVMDPSQQYGLEVSQRYNEASTISQMALGAPPTGALAFSAISLLVQSGRLPLMGVKQVGGQLVGNLLNFALRWYKEDAKSTKLYNPANGEPVEITADDIPERVVVNCGLEPDLPTDKMQLANVGEALVSSGLASKRWVRENILSIGQSDTMDGEIWTDQRISTELSNRLMELTEMNKAKIAMAQQAMQMQAQQAAQQAMAAQQGAPAAGNPFGAPGPGAAVPAGMPGTPMPGANGSNAQPPLNNMPPGGQVSEGQPATGPYPTRGTPPGSV